VCAQNGLPREQDGRHYGPIGRDPCRDRRLARGVRLCARLGGRRLASAFLLLLLLLRCDRRLFHVACALPFLGVRRRGHDDGLSRDRRRDLSRHGLDRRARWRYLAAA
jgi:hypothetical protein